MAEQGLLPKFAPVGRPVSLAPREFVRAQEGSSGRFASLGSGVKSEPARAKFSPGRAEQPDLQPAAAKPAPACANAVPTSTDFFRLRRSPPAKEVCGTSRPVSSAQGELTLDAVKVVRNDLSDADFDVVSVEREREEPSREAARRDPPPVKSVKSELGGMIWSRLKTRLFNPERVRA